MNDTGSERARYEKKIRNHEKNFALIFIIFFMPAHSNPHIHPIQFQSKRPYNIISYLSSL